MKNLPLSLLALLFLPLLACSDSESAAPCDSGTYRACLCGSASGEQLCLAGTWDTCVCVQGPDASPADAGASVDATSDSADDPSDTGAAVDTSESGDVPCECPPQTHCDDEGFCQADVCTKGATTCATLQSLKICDENGASFTEEACPESHVCFGGVCTPPICEPNEITGCLDGGLAVCNSIGTDTVKTPCPAGLACAEGECKPVPPNVLLLIDTSGSMNWDSNGQDPTDCFGGSCPVWSHPNCDNGPSAYTRLGKVKEALNTVIASAEASDIRFALQRFAQVPWPSPSNPLAFLLGPDCAGGYWDMPETNISLISGDDDSHQTSVTGWFGQNISQIIAHGFPTAGPMNTGLLSSWFDGVETVAQTSSYCADSSACNGNPCLNSSCAVTTNPELRAVGATPIGKSLFYAGEYLRHMVLVQGKFCEEDSDCGSSNHTCVDGQCHDEFAYCRENVIVLFSDGAETENVHIDDFFHPRVQAKRLHYGLGCQQDADCLSGALCVGGVCRPPEGAVDEAAMVCETGGAACTNSIQCPDPCITWSNCQGYCTPTSVDYVDPIVPANRLIDAAGVPRPVRVHVVDASGVEGQNEIIAAYGGGVHVSVDLANPEELLSTVTQILGDVKGSNVCGAP